MPAVSAGIPRTDDFNGARQVGAGWYQVTASEGKRQSAATFFLRPELDRENLSVLTDYLALKIRIVNRQAVAFEAKDAAGMEILTQARREIVLCAGSFHSSKLLMLSGVGPRDELLRHGIDVVYKADEVGRNYQDHVDAPVTQRLVGVKGLHGADRGLAAPKHGIDYCGFRRGLLMSNLLPAGVCSDTAGNGRLHVQHNLAPLGLASAGPSSFWVHLVSVCPTAIHLLLLR